MIRNRGSKNYSSRSKNESVEDPHELLLSLVDMGSLDCDECLLACVSEMSDAECKRVLSSLSLPNRCDEVEEEEDDLELEEDAETDDMDEDMEVESDEDSDETVDEDDSEVEDEEDIEVELESRIRRLERNLRAESMNRNRVRRFSRRCR